MCFGRKEEEKHRALPMGKKKSNLAQHVAAKRRTYLRSELHK